MKVPFRDWLWFSVLTLQRTWTFGVGVGWCGDDWTACLVFHFGPWAVFVGPHVEGESA